MRRYLKIYASFVAFSFSRSLEFRLELLIRIAMDIAWYATNFLFFRTLLVHAPTIGGWNQSRMDVFVSITILADALNMVLFSSNNYAFQTLINQGHFDYYLVRPISSLFMATCRQFGASSTFNLVAAAALLIWTLLNFEEPLGTTRVATFLMILCGGVAAGQLLSVLFMYIPAFWTHSTSGFIEINQSLERLGHQPDGIFRKHALRFVLTTVLPYAVVSALPAHVLFEGLSLRHAATITGVLGFLTMTVTVLWREGLKAYSSASS